VHDIDDTKVYTYFVFLHYFFIGKYR